jgi:hypothetical protein
VRFAAITICVASKRVFTVVRYVSVRKLLDTPSGVCVSERVTGHKNKFTNTCQTKEESNSLRGNMTYKSKTAVHLATRCARSLHDTT